MIVMRSAGEADQPRTLRIPQEGLRTWVTRYFERQVGDLYATATVVDQEPHTSGGAHYHAADQFQVVVSGSGMYGKTRVETYSVHFAAAFSPYGPITTSDEHLKWFTLRNGADPGGIKWMPQHREQLHAAHRKPRVVYGHPEIPLQADGLASWHYVLKPGEQRSGESPATGRGQFWLVFKGAGTIAGSAFDEESLLFVGPEEAPVTIEGGSEGLDALAVQFPRAG